MLEMLREVIEDEVFVEDNFKLTFSSVEVLEDDDIIVDVNVEIVGDTILGIVAAEVGFNKFLEEEEVGRAAELEAAFVEDDGEIEVQDADEVITRPSNVRHSRPSSVSPTRKSRFELDSSETFEGKTKFLNFGANGNVAIEEPNGIETTS